MASAEQSPLTLTTSSLVFAFRDFEVPQEIKNLGGEQMFSIHQFIGGRRTLTPFGAAPHETIQWGGILQGANSFARALALDSIRQAGLPATLKYAKWSYTGLVTKVWIEPGHEGWVPYRVEFTPASDDSQGGTNAPPANNDAALNSAVAGMAQLIASYRGSNSNILNTIAKIQNALGKVSGIISAAGGTIAQVKRTNFADPAQDFALATTALAPLDLVPAIGSNGDVVAGLAIANNAMSDLLWSQSAVIALLQLSYMLGVPPINVTTVTVIDPCLLVLAAQAYGDSEQWQAISDANGGFPLFASGTYTLVLPQPQ